jgi:hypothetical protein
MMGGTRTRCALADPVPKAPIAARASSGPVRCLQVLARAVHRWEYDKKEEERQREAKEQQDAERLAFQALDWHDFAVSSQSHWFLTRGSGLLTVVG